MSLKKIVSDFRARYIDKRRLPAAARQNLRCYRVGLPAHDAGLLMVAEARIEWLKRSQDMPAYRDGGSARDFSLLRGWASSYPETSGYIVPTLIDFAARSNDQPLADRAQRMLDWLVSIHFPGGGFQGGKVDAPERVPVTFDTGHILLGLAAEVHAFWRGISAADGACRHLVA
ncbi:MAG: hypothetical protein FAZ92_01007 [Accumulibacter sp.]|uniref:hypothetical protein n=1 Tax=Accumulibacter sp. TaxID=2053492 RepID=UPI00121F9362|nr:hypothetical protein [Accumulibacter sp.]TLD46719.1 MAG: hypothetical protein FAZ92_01007 [Accumulibacter sp.]